MPFYFYSVYLIINMGGAVMEENYPFEIEEINPFYLTDADRINRIEQLFTDLLTILEDA